MADRLAPRAVCIGSVGVVALVDHAERLDGALAAVLRVGLVGVQAVDVEAGDVDVRDRR